MRTSFYVYILANTRGRRPVLYVGVTNDVARRLAEHRMMPLGFVARYHVDSLVHVERTPDAWTAITREKRIKGWTRAKKIALIESRSPEWRDSSAEWGDDVGPGGVPRGASRCSG